MSNDYAVYLRKSRADQEAELSGAGETLARHRQTLMQLATSRGLRVAQVYQEIVSGDTIASRPQMQRLLEMVSQGAYRGVLVMEVERLARGDTIDQGVVARAFQATNTLIVTPYRTYDPANEMDEDYFEFSLFMARREYKMITRRMQAGRAASVKEGKYAGAVEVYGYKRVKLQNQKGWTLEIVPSQARVIMMIFDWYANGVDGKRVGKDAIARRLNEMGLPSPRGDYWRASSIGNLLRNDVLRGYVTWNKRVKAPCATGDAPKIKRPLSDRKIVAKGLHEPIVPQELFDKVQRVLSLNPPAPASTGARLSNPFAGLLFCALCSRAMTRKEEFGPVSAREPGLVCRTRGCATAGIRLSLVEQAVIERLDGIVRTFSPQPPQQPFPEIEAAAIEESIKSLKEQLSRACAFAERGIYDEATFIARRDDILKRLESAKSALIAINAESDISPSAPSEDVRMTLGQLYEMCADAEEKNALLKAVMVKMLFSKTKRCCRNQNPAEHLTLEIQMAIRE